MITLSYIKSIALIAVISGLVLLYASFDPGMTGFFPACPFRSLTGLLCPGCGSQRALHHLLNLKVQIAYSYNPLLVISIPYIIGGAVMERLPNPSQRLLRWRQLFFGRTAILFVLFIILSFWILRNF